MSAETNTPTETSRPAVGNIVWFEIPADDLERARQFYGQLFGLWEMNPNAK